MIFLLGLLPTLAAARISEYINDPSIVRNNYTEAPAFWLNTGDLPETFDWGNRDGRSFLTSMRNQHIPQYCGSCWAHGAVSALQDRIKIARGGRDTDYEISIQHILNCQGGGTCKGGSHFGAYQWMKENDVAMEDANPYTACSADLNSGLCSSGEWTCTPINVARTCGGFTEYGGTCVGLTHFPNVTVAEYGEVPSEVEKIKAEIFARGPIACGVNANPLRDYEGGVYDGDASADIDHVVSIVGWGTQAGTPYWRVRNSWGSYWGEMGFFRVKMGENKLGLEAECAWATARYSEHNFPCHEDGANCVTPAREEEVIA